MWTCLSTVSFQREAQSAVSGRTHPKLPSSPLQPHNTAGGQSAWVYRASCCCCFPIPPCLVPRPPCCVPHPLCSVHMKVSEKMSAMAGRDGGLDSLEILGMYVELPTPLPPVLHRPCPTPVTPLPRPCPALCSILGMIQLRITDQAFGCLRIAIDKGEVVGMSFVGPVSGCVCQSLRRPSPRPPARCAAPDTPQRGQAALWTAVGDCLEAGGQVLPSQQ